MKTHTPHKRPAALRVLLWLGISIGSILVIAVLGLTMATLWLTPPRLTEIVNDVAGKYLNAEVNVSNPRFTLWSTFPRLSVSADSITVVSHAFDNIDKSQRDSLPGGADVLLTTGSVRGGIEILPLFAGKVSLRDISLKELDVNIVSLNDSLANYDIVRIKPSTKVEIPAMRVNHIDLGENAGIGYFSVENDTKANLVLKKLGLTQTSKDKYRLEISGIASAWQEGLPLLAGFPLVAEGDIAVEYHPLKIELSDMGIELGNTHAKMNFSMTSGEDLSFDAFDFRLDTFDVLSLLAYIPGIEIPYLSREDADLAVNASARLLGPWICTGDALPNLEIAFSVPSGDVALTVPDVGNIGIHNISLDAGLVFDGRNPRASVFSLDKFNLMADGVKIDINGRVDDLFGNPEIYAKIRSHLDMAGLRAVLSDLHPKRLRGEFSGITEISCQLTSVDNPDIKGLRARSSFELDRCDIDIPKVPLSMNAQRAKLGASVTADLVSATEAEGLAINLDSEIPDLKLVAGNSALEVKSFKLEGAGQSAIPYRYDGAFPLGMKCTAQHIGINAGQLKTNVKGLTTFAKVGRGKYGPTFFATVKSSSARVDDGKSLVSISGMDMKANVNQAKRMKGANSPYGPSADQPLLANISHSPEYIVLNAPEVVKDFFASWNVKGDARVKEAVVITPAYPVRNELSNVDLGFSLDNLTLRNLDIKSQTNAMHMAANVGNLRNLVLGKGPQRISLALDVALDTIDINSIAKTFETGVLLTTGHPFYKKAKPADVPLTASDSVAMLIPRNIDARIRASIKETVYTELRLDNIVADVDISGGKADVKRVGIDAPFGSASLTTLYNTSDAEHMGIDIGLDIDTINVVKFFENYHTLLLMMPQMSNLSGSISAEAKASLQFFPDMYINVPSLSADLAVQGRSLLVHQDPFIRKITRMMLIRESGDLHIKDMDIHATVRDNLLRLYPFDFAFEGYDLNMVGLNNFNGDMYYHIGVKESPLHFPFGINIKGDFHHPELRFGGATFKDDQAWEVTSGITGAYRINMMHELKYYLKEFVHKAAESATSPDSDYVFPTPARAPHDI